MIRNSNGFALALVLALIPVALAIFLAAFSIISFLQLDLSIKHPCRMHGLMTQHKVSPLLERLLSLNPKATKLKTKLIATQLELEAALLAQNHPLAAKLALKIKSLETQRLILDHQQKNLIQKSNVLLIRGHALTSNQLHKTLLLNHKRTVLYTIKSIVLKTQSPSLAVRPDYADTAPTYSPTVQFEKDQSLAHSWQYEVTTAKPFDKFINGTFKFQKSCSVTLAKENFRWVAKINRDKSWSKSLW